MKLIIARHGETIENKTGIMQGHSPGTLSKKGEKQAQKLAKRLSKIEFDLVYCSDLRRCKQTLSPLLKIKKQKVHYVKELREISRGKFNGKPSKEYTKYIQNKKYKNWLNKNNIKDSWYYRKIPGGESPKDVLKRVSKYVEKIIKKEKGKTILIMTHGVAKRMLLIYLLKKEIKHFSKLHIPNTALSIINIKDDGNHRARLLNNTSHLD
jgi:broad specificity phosphatase PhoE